MQKIRDEIRLLTWKPIVDLLNKARHGTAWAWENTQGIKEGETTLSKAISEAEGKIIESLELIEKQIQKEYPNINKEYIRNLIFFRYDDEPNPEFTKLENELIEILSEKFYREVAKEMVETLDMEGLLESFDSEEEMQKLKNTFPNGIKR